MSKNPIPLAACAAILLFAGCLRGKTPPPTIDPVVERAARNATALAAVLEAASQVADPETLKVFRGFGISVQPNAELDRTFPVRPALAAAVERWPEARKRAALEWVRANATWTTMLHAMTLEAFGPRMEVTDWGPSMSRFNPAIFGNRASLAPLLEDALQDEAVRRIAESVAVQPEPFTPAGVAEHREKLIAYLRLAEPLPAYVGFFDPLLRPTNGANVELRDGSILMVVGPSADTSGRSMILFHEMAHLPVSRVLSRPAAAAALKVSGCALDTIEQRRGYDTWRSFFAEALVRSLSYRLEGVPARDTGLVFEHELTASLEKWEATPEIPFEEAVVAMLNGIADQHCSAGVAAESTSR